MTNTKTKDMDNGRVYVGIDPGSLGFVAVMYPNGDKDFLRNILMYALPSAVENWVNELGMEEADATALYYFVMGGTVNIIEAWMKDSFSATLDETADKLNKLILSCQAAFAQ